jgi:hypothetical protein
MRLIPPLPTGRSINLLEARWLCETSPGTAHPRRKHQQAQTSPENLKGCMAGGERSTTLKTQHSENPRWAVLGLRSTAMVVIISFLLFSLVKHFRSVTRRLSPRDQQGQRRETGGERRGQSPGFS